jgi:hypothetical protein
LPFDWSPCHDSRLPFQFHTPVWPPEMSIANSSDLEVGYIERLTFLSTVVIHHWDDRDVHILKP